MDIMTSSRVDHSPSHTAHVNHNDHSGDDDHVEDDALDASFVADEVDASDAADDGGGAADDVEVDAPLVEHIPVSDSRWHRWSEHVLAAIVSGVRDTETLLASRPGKIGPSKLRQCLAWLEIRGLVIWSTRHGWRATDLGRTRVSEAESALTLSVEIEQSLFERG